MSKYYETAEHAITASVALSVVDMITVALKFWTRRIQKQPLMADDWLLVLATLLTMGIGIAITYGATHHAIGWPFQVPPDYKGDPALLVSDQVTLARKIQYAFLIMYPLALGSIKASFLFMYKRIFSIGKKTRLLLTTTIIIVAAWSVAFCFAELFQCSTKFWANWGSTHDIRTQCVGTTRLLYTVCITDFLLDVVIIAIPIKLVWQLNLSTATKFGVISIFLLGSITVAASLLRLILVTPLVFGVHESAPNNRFVSITTSLYWGMIETGVGILAACLPTLQFLLRKNRWRPLFGLNSTDSADVSPSRPFHLKLPSNPVIHVDRTVDVAYESKCSSPVITRAKTWIRRNESVDGPDDIEMRDSIFQRR
ncbi:hypothetical protein F4821DRAFT_241794 [Hypoxylon rubiginosum]|uniref:Uncharacterized protein n=1 Tax=Hypoxylon rubiginosum TaxID=110542 RepID=A0ACC0CXC8_9PEZI|nr:hypothetical protein F4821DRAFT_241794 [Hypoxylon rubiginosum]